MTAETPQISADAESGPDRDLRDLLISGERLRVRALQHRLFALTHRREVAAATSNRFIWLRRRLLGGFDPADVRWQDLRDVRLNVGMIGADLTVIYTSNLSDTAGGAHTDYSLFVRGLSKADARELYRICQAEEQAWREKRRIRDLEEMRAQSGGFQMGPGGGGVGPSVGAESAAEKLAAVKNMLDEGLISDSEFESIKARIIASI